MQDSERLGGWPVVDLGLSPAVECWGINAIEFVRRRRQA